MAASALVYLTLLLMAFVVLYGSYCIATGLAPLLVSLARVVVLMSQWPFWR